MNWNTLELNESSLKIIFWNYAIGKMLMHLLKHMLLIKFNLSNRYVIIFFLILTLTFF